MTSQSHITAFSGPRRIASGSAAEVALALKALGSIEPMALVFDDKTGGQIDLDLRGSEAEIAARYAPVATEPAASTEDEGQGAPATAAPAGRGRPKLGVVAREVTLLPRHWDWLAAQPGGASVALRKLVDQARKASEWDDMVRRIREATSRFLSAIAGDLPQYEEATRALFAGDKDRFDDLVAGWPADIRDHAREMARGAFA